MPIGTSIVVAVAVAVADAVAVAVAVAVAGHGVGSRISISHPLEAHHLSFFTCLRVATTFARSEGVAASF